MGGDETLSDDEARAQSEREEMFGPEEPNKKPKVVAPQRAHVLKLEIGADTTRELASRLREIAMEAERFDALPPHSLSAGPHSSVIFAYTHLPKSHEEYCDEVRVYLDQSRKEDLMRAALEKQVREGS